MALTLTEQVCPPVQPEHITDVLVVVVSEQSPPQSDMISYEPLNVDSQLLAGSDQVKVNVESSTTVTIKLMVGGAVRTQTHNFY